MLEIGKRVLVTEDLFGDQWYGEVVDSNEKTFCVLPDSLRNHVSMVKFPLMFRQSDHTSLGGVFQATEVKW